MVIEHILTGTWSGVGGRGLSKLGRLLVSVNDFTGTGGAYAGGGPLQSKNQMPYKN